MYNNNLTIDDVKQHHYYSGKNCPQTMRMNDMWDYFLSLVQVEYQALLLIKEGYNFKLITDSRFINGNGIVTTKEILKPLKYQIEITKEKQKVILNFEIK